MFFPVEDAVCKHQYPFSFDHGEGRIVGVFQAYADRFDIKIFNVPMAQDSLRDRGMASHGGFQFSIIPALHTLGDQTWLAGKI